jgi:hypothetical protein
MLGLLNYYKAEDLYDKIIDTNTQYYFNDKRDVTGYYSIKPRPQSLVWIPS